MDLHGVDPLELAVRAALVALLLLLAGLMAGGHPRHRVAQLGALLALGVAAFAIETLPHFAAPPLWWQLPVIALSAGTSVVFWLFSRALFDDDFQLNAGHGLAWASMAGAPVVACTLLRPEHADAARVVGQLVDLGTFGFAALAVAQTLASWRADLVERRRRLRIFIVGGGAAYATVAAVVRLTRADTGAPHAGMVDMLVLLVIVAVIASRMLRVTGADMFDDGRQPAEPARPPSPQSDADIATALSPDVDPADIRLVERLHALMGVERFHQQEDASIGALAARLAVPEHRLRRLINQHLGHRNFNAFLNRYRLADAKAALADPAKSELPILSIAMDAGFQSLGPFNRAFKADTGLTPSEYRRRGGRPMPAETAIPLADFEIGQ